MQTSKILILAWFAIAASILLMEHAVINRNFQEYVGDVRAPGGYLRLNYLPPTAGAAQPSKRLAVVVPAYAGDLDKALASLAKWPQTCHRLTQQNSDLLLYYAGGDDGHVNSVGPSLAETGGRCFANTRIILANLTKEEGVYPKGPSVQFYKLFLDSKVRDQIKQYDALALIEWDVIVAHERSFEMLYRAAFGGVEPFWMKGSTLEGTNFHDTVISSEQRHILGHINGNAIYNNTDPAFVDFVNYTLARWDYSYSYDVALWVTIADFPYSWPLWQRFARKFVATNLIANVGFLDVDQQTVRKAIEHDTLFIHGSLTGGGGSMFKASVTGALARKTMLRGGGQSSDECTDACGRAESSAAAHGGSSVCDRTCYAGKGGARFGGFMCGAGDASKYGKQCRMCYLDLEEARKAQRLLLEEFVEGRGVEELKHVVMCETLLPPTPSTCSAKCAMKDDTVCDESCGKGRFGDYNCNWRGYGSQCRFCFNDREAALAADRIAKRRGGRVIMCNTFEPPREVDEWALVEEVAPDTAKEEEPGENDPLDDSSSTDDEEVADDMLPFTTHIKRGELCAFMIGHGHFIRETQVSVESVIQFMPGMTIAVAVRNEVYSVYNRTLGSLPGVRISNSTNPSNSALLADRYCGDNVKLIYYMNPGDVISRTFTSKDTHSAKGELVVAYTALDRAHETSLARMKASTSVLGFRTPLFSFGTDIILPSCTNQQLRDVLLSDKSVREGAKISDDEDEMLDDDTLALETIAGFNGVYIPEVLAGLAYSRNTPGVWFIDPQQWVTHHMFEPATIWDIPLVRPRIGCAVDISLSFQGYDTAAYMDMMLRFFGRGGRCDTGYVPPDTRVMRPKAQIEFGDPTGKAMPNIERGDISVVYSIKQANEDLFFVSLNTVAERFPRAAEVVIVFSGELSNRDRLQEVINAVERDAEFPILVVDDVERLTDGAETWYRLRAGTHCRGKFVLHLEPTEILMENITYDHIFHFGKPVLPFGRFQLTGGRRDALPQCTTDTMTAAIGQPVVHDFVTYHTVYPREAYVQLRDFIEEQSSISLEKFINRDRKKCKLLDQAEPEIPRVMYEMSLMGSYLWHYMRDSIHWRATHPLDLDPDEWMSDVHKYQFTCDVPGIEIPDDDDESQRTIETLQGLRTRDDCRAFKSLQ